MYIVKHEALLKACMIVGSQTKLAKSIGVTRARVNNWLNRDDRVSLEHILAIESLTGGKVSRYDLVSSFNNADLLENEIKISKEICLNNLSERFSCLELCINKKFKTLEELMMMLNNAIIYSNKNKGEEV